MSDKNENPERKIKSLHNTIEKIIIINNIMNNIDGELHLVQEILMSMCNNSDHLKHHFTVSVMKENADLMANIINNRAGFYDIISKLTELYFDLTDRQYFDDAKKKVPVPEIISNENVNKNVNAAKEEKENKDVLKSKHKINLLNPQENINLANAIQYFSEKFSDETNLEKDATKEIPKIKKIRKKKEDNDG